MPTLFKKLLQYVHSLQQGSPEGTTEIKANINVHPTMGFSKYEN